MEVNVQKLKALRKRRALSQHELADVAGVGRSTIARIEAGASGAHGRTLRRLAHALGVDVSELVDVREEDHA
jgi:transcriptional regulator with XRE-family HTH domain